MDTANTMVILQYYTMLQYVYNTIYVLYGFIPIIIKGMVFAGIGMVMKVDTHSISMINLNHITATRHPPLSPELASHFIL